MMTTLQVKELCKKVINVYSTNILEALDTKPVVIMLAEEPLAWDLIGVTCVDAALTPEVRANVLEVLPELKGEDVYVQFNINALMYQSYKLRLMVESTGLEFDEQSILVNLMVHFLAHELHHVALARQDTKAFLDACYNISVGASGVSMDYSAYSTNLIEQKAEAFAEEYSKSVGLQGYVLVGALNKMPIGLYMNQLDKYKATAVLDVNEYVYIKGDVVMNKKNTETNMATTGVAAIINGIEYDQAACTVAKEFCSGPYDCGTCDYGHLIAKGTSAPIKADTLKGDENMGTNSLALNVEINNKVIPFYGTTRVYHAYKDDVNMTMIVVHRGKQHTLKDYYKDTTSGNLVLVIGNKKRAQDLPLDTAFEMTNEDIYAYCADAPEVKINDTAQEAEGVNNMNNTALPFAPEATAPVMVGQLINNAPVVAEGADTMNTAMEQYNQAAQQAMTEEAIKANFQQVATNLPAPQALPQTPQATTAVLTMPTVSVTVYRAKTAGSITSAEMATKSLYTQLYKGTTYGATLDEMTSRLPAEAQMIATDVIYIKDQKATYMRGHKSFRQLDNAVFFENKGKKAQPAPTQQPQTAVPQAAPLSPFSKGSDGRQYACYVNNNAGYVLQETAQASQLYGLYVITFDGKEYELGAVGNMHMGNALICRTEADIIKAVQENKISIVSYAEAKKFAKAPTPITPAPIVAAPAQEALPAVRTKKVMAHDTIQVGLDITHTTVEVAANIATGVPIVILSGLNGLVKGLNDGAYKVLSDVNDKAFGC